MAKQPTEQVELGEIKVSDRRTVIFEVPDVGAGLAVFIYDHESKVGGVAHIVLPESSLSGDLVEGNMPGKYADKAIPALISEFSKLGGKKRSASVHMVGGAQLFNFGGGGGNILNIGARNSTAVRTALLKQNLTVEKADTGGNKSKHLHFSLASGEVTVETLGGKIYSL